MNLKFLAFFGLLGGLVSAAQGNTLTPGPVITLECTWQLNRAQPVGAPRYQVLKATFRDASNKWSFKYQIKKIPQNPTAQPEIYDLVPAGNGDEDYDDYLVVDQQKTSGVKGGSVQRRFKWASINVNGTSAYSCR